MNIFDRFSNRLSRSTHSGLKLRQWCLKLRHDQLKWLVFDIKLLVGTATDRQGEEEREEGGGRGWRETERERETKSEREETDRQTRRTGFNVPEEFYNFAITFIGHIFLYYSDLMTWGNDSVDRLNSDVSKSEVKSLGFSSPSCKHTLSCWDKQPVSGSML